MATNRPAIDSQDYKSREGLIIEAVCDRSLKKEFTEDPQQWFAPAWDR
jgi:hypothetical protein